MKIFQALALFPLVALGAPESQHPQLSKRATLCGSGESIDTRNFHIQNEYYEDSGSQCLTVTGQFDNTLWWSTAWTWTESSSSVKSFTAARGRYVGESVIAKIVSIPTTWAWEYNTTKDIVANVLYDVAGSPKCGQPADWHIQIWLASFGGLKPSGQRVGGIKIDGVNYALYRDLEGHSYTFVSQSPQPNFSGDLRGFLTYLEQRSDILPSWCIGSIKAGTQAVYGAKALFTTKALLIDHTLEPPTTTNPPLPVATRDPDCLERWAQCGGQGWSGAACCQKGDFCAFWNDYESQCLPQY